MNRSSTRLRLAQCELSEANEFIGRLHRHHKPVQGHRFSLAAVNEDGEIVGVATVGRPVARKTPAKDVLEVTRLCTDGTPNACSFLYGAAARAGKALGYKKIQTFILRDEESGHSLLASGWSLEGESQGGQWVRTDGSPRRTDQPTAPKSRWAKELS